MFNWDKAFFNVSLNEKVAIVNKTILNILIIWVQLSPVQLDDEGPPWLNSKMKILIQEKSKIFTKVLEKITETN